MSDFLEIITPEAEKRLKQVSDELVKIANNVELINKKAILVDSPKKYTDETKKLNTELEKQKTIIEKLKNQALKQQEVSEKSAEKQRLAEIKLQQQREKTFDKYEAQLTKEQLKLAQSQSLYAKLEQKLKSLQNSYRDLAVKKELGISLTEKEERRYNSLQSKIQNYDKTLKAVDASTGKFSRNVGNYASGFNPLSNSINQLGREASAFTNSLQTGFMAISNNLPIFFDAIENVIQQNKELQKQGQPTKSVLSQISSSLFSFQTLLSVGVTLLTVYGKEIFQWIGSLFGASKALDELNKRQKEFNEARFQGKKDAQSDIIELKKYLSLYNNLKLSDEDRAIAFKKITEQYAYYIKNVKDATMINGKYSEGVNKLLIDLEKQKALEKETSIQVSNKQKLIDIEKELTTLKKLESQTKKAFEAEDLRVQKTGVNRVNLILRNKAEDAYNSALSARIAKEKEASKYQEAINANQVEIQRLTNERIGLEFQDTKEKEKKTEVLKKLDLAEKDYLNSLYELDKQRLEQSMEINKAILDDDENNFDVRFRAEQQYYKAKSALIDLESDEAVRLLQKGYADEKQEIEKAYQDKLNEIKEAEKKENTIVVNGAETRATALNEKNKALLALQEDYNFKSITQKEKHDKSIFDFETELTKKITDEVRRRTDLLINENKVSAEELGNARQYLLELQNVNEFTNFKDLEKRKTELLERFVKERISLKLLEKIAEKEMIKDAEKDVEKKEKLEQEILTLKKQYIDESIKEKEREVAEIKKLNEEIANYAKTFSTSFASETNTSSLFKILNKEIDGFGESSKSTFLAVSEAGQELFNQLAGFGQENFDQLYTDLEKQKEVSLRFAGESEEAKQALEEQYEIKRRAIQKREAEQKKDMAVFNATINMLQAIVGALPNVPLSIAVGVIGALNIARIKSQEIPELFVGTNNAKEGVAKVDERGAEIHTDSKGNIKDFGSKKGARLKMLEKGDKIIPAEKSKKILTDFQYMTTGQLMKNMPLAYKLNFETGKIENKLDNLTNVISEKESFTFVMDKNGSRIFEKKQGVINEKMNNLINVISKNV